LFVIIENIKKPIATMPNLKASAENGSLLSINGFVVMKADDQRIIKIKGNILIIATYKTNFIN
jgi:hypothetical protein